MHTSPVSSHFAVHEIKLKLFQPSCIPLGFDFWERHPFRSWSGSLKREKKRKVGRTWMILLRRYETSLPWHKECPYLPNESRVLKGKEILWRFELLWHHRAKEGTTVLRQKGDNRIHQESFSINSTIVLCWRLKQFCRQSHMRLTSFSFYLSSFDKIHFKTPRVPFFVLLAWLCSAVTKRETEERRERKQQRKRFELFLHQTPESEIHLISRHSLKKVEEGFFVWTIEGPIHQAVSWVKLMTLNRVCASWGWASWVELY